jgi:hypothetical protein
VDSTNTSTFRRTFILSSSKPKAAENTFTAASKVTIAMNEFDIIGERLSMPIEGPIGYFGLQDWWLTTFSEQERVYIIRTFQPLGISVRMSAQPLDGRIETTQPAIEDHLTRGKISRTSQTPISLLSSLAGWFQSASDRSIADRILDKASELVDGSAPVLDCHFLYQAAIEIYYKDREDPHYMVKAIEACWNQIRLAPRAAEAFRGQFRSPQLPSHKGYEQLAIILEKQKRWADAIALCQQAEAQGWNGGWRHRIERCQTKSSR